MSCETQLLIILQDPLYIEDRRSQIDLAILDFSKAFETPKHSQLYHMNSSLVELEYYDIHGPMLNSSAICGPPGQCRQWY